MRSGPKENTWRERFWEKVDTTNPDGCWEWLGGRISSGYGLFYTVTLGGKRKYITAHKASFLLHRSYVPKGYLVCHECDNKLCVRPDHLYIGTHRGNMVDAAVRGQW